MKKRYYVLFVCSGNTCRSPLAEALMKSKIMEKRIGNVSVSSAGVSAVRGLRAAENSRTVARELGASLAGFRSSPVTARRVALADLILTMEDKHRSSILERWPGADGKVHVITEFSGSGRRGISDPVGGPLDAYRECGLALQDEINKIVPGLKKLISTRGKK
ncbi:MAG: low molecular weight protein arginine phosphatase [bacterium]|jgi:protein-tyrosine phosphatase